MNFFTFEILIMAEALQFAGGYNNINVADTCSVGLECLRCLSRTSPDLERCLQLYIYVTNTNAANQREVESYCSGDCPIILATANEYCNGDARTTELLRVCPSYSYEPTGSFNVRYNDQCLYHSTSSRCYHCLGHDNKEALRCLQILLLAATQNYTTTYSNMLCEGDCPALFGTLGWYCGGNAAASVAYSYCRSNGNDYCGDLRLRHNSQLQSGAESCRQDCTSADCESAISEYGCCLREMIGDSCSTIPTCNLLVDVPIKRFKLNDRCPVLGCSQCLARGSRKLEQCQQRFNYLSYVDGQINRDVLSDAKERASTNQDYCSSECPALMSTSNFYCSGITESQVTNLICPSYSVVPRASVEVTATYGSPQRTCNIRDDCAECIGRRSPEVNKCQQLYSLTFHPNQSSFYLNEYCSSNCPLTLGTAGWYCNSVTSVETFNRCRQRKSDGSRDFCESLILQDSNQFNTSMADCVSDCTSAECQLARNVYGCCLNFNSIVAANCGIPECDIMTAGSPPVMATSLTVAVLSALEYYLFN